MKILTALMTGAALIALTPATAAADDTDLSFAVHDIIVSSNIPAINISVRNLSPSPFAAMRNLRVTSPTPSLNVAGQVWCKSFQHAHTRADQAQVLFGNASVVTAHDGADVLPLGTWSPSPVAQLGGNETLRNYNINAPVNFPDHWNGGVSFGFNPVREVEQRMQQYVQNGAGTEADFLRQDDIFETTIKMNAVGWCEYDSPNLSNKRYAGLRQIEVPVHIFYHGDDDIEDQVSTVGSSGTVQAPPPGPGPSFAPPPGRRGREAAPPSRRTSPSRHGAADTIRPGSTPEPAAGYIHIDGVNGESAEEALLLPAVQHQQEPQETRGDEPQADRPRTDGIGDTIRREAARAAIGALFGSVRAPRGSGSRDRSPPPPPRRR